MSYFGSVSHIGLNYTKENIRNIILKRKFFLNLNKVSSAFIKQLKLINVEIIIWKILTINF